MWRRSSRSPEYKSISPELHSLDASYREKPGFCPVHALLCQRLDPLALLTILAYSWNPGFIYSMGGFKAMQLGHVGRNSLVFRASPRAETQKG